MSTNPNSLLLDEIEEVEHETHAQVVCLVERTKNNKKDSPKEKETISISGRITVSF